jgi:hypothetical protein
LTARGERWLVRGPLRLAAALVASWLVAGECRALAESETRKPMEELVDVKFRAGASLDAPLVLLPPELRSEVTSAAPLVTLDAKELDRLGAAAMGRWFRLRLAPGANVGRFLDALRRVDRVEHAERAPQPAPMGP